MKEIVCSICNTAKYIKLGGFREWFCTKCNTNLMKHKEVK